MASIKPQQPHSCTVVTRLRGDEYRITDKFKPAGSRSVDVRASSFVNKRFLKREVSLNLLEIFRLKGNQEDGSPSGTVSRKALDKISAPSGVSPRARLSSRSFRITYCEVLRASSRHSYRSCKKNTAAPCPTISSSIAEIGGKSQHDAVDGSTDQSMARCSSSHRHGFV
jgi:hypothetical protein